MCKLRAFISLVLAVVFAATISVAGTLFAAAPAQARTHSEAKHHSKTAHDKTARAKTARAKTARAKTTHTKAAEAKAAAAKAIEATTPQAKTQAETQAPTPAPSQPPNQTPSPAPTAAQNCPGNPNALGTSRVLAIDPAAYRRVGLMQYPQTLPLADKEIVLTFDDGPLPPYSNRVLDILAAQCVKATYFLVGGMAHYFPSVVRRIHAEGHTIGSHSEDHPPGFEKLSVKKLRQEIDQGIADVAAALGDPTELAPFFRIPGLARTDTNEEELAARSLIIFSADVVADDWHRHIKPSEIIRRAVSRLQARGKGILLLHDIHPVTVAALPGLLKELKEQGFHVVQVVPAEPARIETAGAPMGLLTASLMPWANDHGAPNWPPVIAGLPAAGVALPAPARQEFDTSYRPWREAMLTESGEGAAIVAVAGVDARRPDRAGTAAPAAAAAAAAELPAPSMQDIGVPLAGWHVVGETLALRSSLAATDASATGIAAAAATAPAPAPAPN